MKAERLYRWRWRAIAALGALIACGGSHRPGTELHVTVALAGTAHARANTAALELIIEDVELVPCRLALGRVPPPGIGTAWAHETPDMRSDRWVLGWNGSVERHARFDLSPPAGRACAVILHIGGPSHLQTRGPPAADRHVLPSSLAAEISPPLTLSEAERRAELTLTVSLDALLATVDAAPSASIPSALRATARAPSETPPAG